MADEAQVKLLTEKGVKDWNEWRKANPEILPDLSGAELSGVDLRKADLSRANLRWANLRRADLSGANLSGTYLSGTNLGATNLSGAKLFKADLFVANMSTANLCEAIFILSNLNGARATEADFSKCIMQATQLGNIDLSRTKGLETVIHGGPSTIGLDTIYLSGGNIPEVFLRGAGVPEPFIFHMKSLVAALSPIEFYSCFISYSHADKAFGRQLHDHLQARGVRCWLDEHQLLAGDDIYHEVDRGIRLWDKMLLCCSENSLTSWWVDNEIGTAFEKEQQIMKERGAKVQVLVPLNLDGYLFSDKWNSGFQGQIRRRLAADFTQSATDWIKFDAEMESLIRALRTDEGAREKPPRTKL